MVALDVGDDIAKENLLDKRNGAESGLFLILSPVEQHTETKREEKWDYVCSVPNEGLKKLGVMSMIIKRVRLHLVK